MDVAPMRFFALVVFGIVAAFAAGGANATNATGTIAGIVGTTGGSSFQDDLATVPARMQIVALAPDGSATGSLHFGNVRRNATGAAELPYTIDHVPLDIVLHVSATPTLAAPASPVPTGFFLTFRLEKSHGDPAVPYYAVTLHADRARIDDCDFDYQTIEVPPALPLPGPMPSTR
jgi:hypothetical protein